MRAVYLHQCVIQQRKPNAEGMDSICAAVGSLCVQLMGELLDKMPTAPAKDCPLFFGSGFGVLADLHEFDRVSVERGPLYVSPTRFPDTVLNAPACRASIVHRLTGPIYNLSNGLTSGLDALGMAMTYIASGQTDEAMVCAAEEVSSIARCIAPSLTFSSGAAFALSCRESEIRLYDYRKERAETKHGTDLFPLGCVEPLRRLYLASRTRQSGEIVLSAQQDDCRSSVGVSFTYTVA